MIENNNLSLYQLNNLIRKKKEIYATLSCVYFLPSIKSKACNKIWLRELSKENCSYFKIRNKDVRQVYVEVRRGNNAFTLLQHLENLLTAKRLPSTGLTAKTLPDIEWLFKVILTLDPEDTLNIKQPHTNVKYQTKQEFLFDPNLIGVLNTRPISRGPRGFYNNTVADQNQQLIQIRKQRKIERMKQKVVYLETAFNQQRQYLCNLLSSKELQHFSCEEISEKLPEEVKKAEPLPHSITPDEDQTNTLIAKTFMPPSLKDADTVNIKTSKTADYFKHEFYLGYQFD